MILVDGKPAPSCAFRIWSVNRWLRWLGFRMFVGTPDSPDGWTVIGFVWHGWAFVKDGE